jgi:colanic acid/amylovoran biosynthesis protein
MNHSEGGLFVLAGNWAYSNRGCEAIVRGTTALFREEVGECRFISNYFTEEKCPDAQREMDPSIIHRPFPFLKRYSLPWIHDQIARRLFHRPPFGRVMSQTLRRSLEEKEVKAVLMLGGDNLSLDYGGADTYFGLSSLAVAHNLPVTVWGASIGPFTSDPDYERWATEKLRKISLLCARETETLAYLASIGLEENVILAADPAFHLQPSPCELPADIEMALLEGCIGLNLSPLMRQYMHGDELSRLWQKSRLFYRYMHRDEISRSLQKSLLSWAQVAAEIVRGLLNRFSQPLLLIPHVMSEAGDVERDDYLFLRRVAQLVQEPERVFVLGPNLNAAQTKWVISRLRVFAGARTHSTLAAISSGVPTICIGYSMKARGIAKDVYGHLEWLVKGQDLIDPSVLCDRLVSLCDQESAIRQHLERVNPTFRQRAREALKRFLDIIELHRRPVGDF